MDLTRVALVNWSAWGEDEKLVTIVQFPSSGGGDWNGPRDPWVTDSIYRLIESSIDQTSGQLPANGLDLPDENATRKGETIGWVAGARDGVAGASFPTLGNTMSSRCSPPLR
jgi:hypothetical protein